MLKILRYTLYLVGFLLFLWWFLFAHVVFYKRELTYMQYETKNHVIVKHYVSSPINPIGIYYWLTTGDGMVFNGGNPLFIILYDKNGKYLGQTSPFYMMDIFSYAGGNSLGKYVADELQGDDPNEISLSLGLEPAETAYTVNIKHKKWWSIILQYFY